MSDTTNGVRDERVPGHVPAHLVADIDIFDLPNVAAGFHAAWENVQATAPGDFIWTPRNGGHWIATNGSQINKIYADYRRFSSRNKMVPKSEFGTIDALPTTLDPPANGPYRKLMNGALAPQAVLRLEPKVRELAASLIAGFGPAGHCDFVADYAEILPINIFIMLMDLPLADAPALKKLANRITRPEDTSTVARDLLAVQDYLRPWIKDRREGEGQDLLSSIVNGQIGGRKITLEEAMAMSTQVLIGGLDTVANSMCFVMHFLATNPSKRAELVADPALIPLALNELLRRYPVAMLGREVVEDLVYEGVEFRQGDMVMLPTVLHGMDERVNENALVVDFQRETAEHSTFGEGGQKCPGSNLARLELRITIEEWLKAIPEFSIKPNQAITFGGGVVGGIDILPLTWPVPA